MYIRGHKYAFKDKNASYSVHVFRVFESVCDIFLLKSVCKESEKELFRG